MGAERTRSKREFHTRHSFLRVKLLVAKELDNGWSATHYQHQTACVRTK
jgi:hypothetical protein